MRHVTAALGLTAACLPWAAQAEPTAVGNTPSGYRIAAVDAGSGVALGSGLVVGRDGGTGLVGISARLRLPSVALEMGVPMTFYMTPAGGRAALGNVRASIFGLLEPGPLHLAIGIEGHIGAGPRAYTVPAAPYSVHDIL